jgi:hypothetical protein
MPIHGEMARHPALLEGEGGQAAHHQAANHDQHRADNQGMARPGGLDLEAHHQRDQGEERAGGRRHAGEVGARPGRWRRVGVERRVEPRKSQRRAHRKHQRHHPAQCAAVLQRGKIKHQRRGDAEAEEVRQRIELGAEAAGDAQAAGDAAVEGVEDGGDDDGDDGESHLALQPETDRRQPRAERRQGQHVGDQPIDRKAAQAAAPGVKIVVHREAPHLPPLVIRGEVPA